MRLSWWFGPSEKPRTPREFWVTANGEKEMSGARKLAWWLNFLGSSPELWQGAESSRGDVVHCLLRGRPRWARELEKGGFPLSTYDNIKLTRRDRTGWQLWLSNEQRQTNLKCIQASIGLELTNHITHRVYLIDNIPPISYLLTLHFFVKSCCEM